MHWTYPRCLLVFILLSSVIAFAQMRTAIPVRTAPVDLGGITQRAGTIFVGRVLKIEPVRVASSNDLASVQITCAVEHGVRGTRDGEILSFREWAGLWTDGPRYRIGQRLMLFLYAPSALGLTSPVGGRLGQFVVDRDGRVVLSPGQQQSIRVLPKPVGIDIHRPIPLRQFTRACGACRRIEAMARLIHFHSRAENSKATPETAKEISVRSESAAANRGGSRRARSGQ